MIRFALQHPHLVCVVALIVFILGGISYFRLPADLLPIFKTPAVQIITFYPGMPPVIMERDIMSRMQRWTGQSNGIEHQEAKAMPGVCVVKDFFHEHIDANTAMSQVTSLAMSDLFYLPPGTIPPMVMPFDPTASVPLCLIAVSSQSFSEKELYDIAYFDMRNQLQAISGVIAPAVYGGKLRRILAYVDKEKLQARHLAPMEVVESLSRFNSFIPMGNARFGDIDYQIDSNAMVRYVDELNEFPLKTREGANVFLKDVGQAKDTSQIQTNIVRINGRRQVYIPIYRQPGANTIQIVSEVQRKTELILQRIINMKKLDPKTADLRIDVVMDQSLAVQKSIGGLQIAGLLGAVLVAVVILAFLRTLWGTLVIVLALPMAVFSAFLGLYLGGQTLNSMTLGGLALAIGILVDQSIVVLDNINRHLQLGKSSGQAALIGASEMAGPVLVSTMTFVVVFLPVLFLSGMARFLFVPLALAAILAIGASYFVSLTVLPALSARLLRPSAGTPSATSSLALAYGQVVRLLLSLKWAILLAVLVACILAGWLLFSLGTELFPQIDAGQFTVFVRGYSGMSLEESERLVARIEREIAALTGAPDPASLNPQSDLQLLIANIGVLMDWPAAYTPNAAPMDSFLLVQLKRGASKSSLDYAEALRKRLPEQFPGIEFAVDTGGILTAALNFGLPSPIQIQVSGSQLETSQQIAQTILREIQHIEGVRDARIYQRLDYPVIEIAIDRIKAASIGTDADTIAKTIVTACNSSVNFKPSFWIDEGNGNHYFIGVQYPEERIESMETLENIPINTATGIPTLLKNIATFHRSIAPATVNHVNITRVVDLYVNVHGRAVGSVAKDIEATIAQSPAIRKLLEEYTPKGYRLSVHGETKRMRESFAQFRDGLLIATLLVYLVLVVQFRSLRDPLLIMSAVPMGFVGVAAALFLSSTHINIPVFMGMIMTVGMVVEYNVILIEFANRLQEEAGLSKAESIIRAAQVRLVPILMTSLTTIFALLPMALNLGGLGGPNQPLALTMLGGVMGALVLSLLVMPPLYVVLASERHRN